MKTVVGLFDQFDEARRAVQDLRDAGFTNENISMIARDEGGQYSRYLDADKSGVKEDVGGAAKGAGLGAVMGGLGGLLVGLGALMIPGIGPVIAAGPIITTLAGAGVGAVAGGVVGALVDLGIPDEHANYYAEGVRRGGTLVVLRADDMRADAAADIMNRYHPVDVEHRAADWRQGGDWKGFNPDAGEYTALGMTNDRMPTRSAIPVTGTDDINDRGGLDDLSHGQDYNRDSGMGMGAGTHSSQRDEEMYGLKHGQELEDDVNPSRGARPGTGPNIGGDEELYGVRHGQDMEDDARTGMRRDDMLDDDNDIPVTGRGTEDLYGLQHGQELESDENAGTAAPSGAGPNTGGDEELYGLRHGQDIESPSESGMMRDNDPLNDDHDIPVTGRRDMGVGTGTSEIFERGTTDDQDLGTIDSSSLHHSSAQDFGRDMGLGMNDPSSRQNFGDQSTGTTDRDYNTGVGNQGYNRGTTADDRDFNSSQSGSDFEKANFGTSDSDMDDDIPVTGRPMAGDAYPSTLSGSDMQTMGGDWADYDAQFRSDYMTRYNNSGQSYAYYQPAYRFGYDLRSDAQYRDWDWNRIEPVARQEWQRRGLVGRWDEFKDAVRHAWDSMRG